MASTRIPNVLFELGLVAAIMGLGTYGLGFWLTSGGNYTPVGGISMILGIFCILAAGLLLVFSLVAKIAERW